jgi:hypothetical protein
MMRMFAGVVGFVGEACITLTTWPPMVIDAEREDEAVFCAIV